MIYAGVIDLFIFDKWKTNKKWLPINFQCGVFKKNCTYTFRKTKSSPVFVCVFR